MLRRVVSFDAVTDAVADFESACGHLATGAYDLVVCNLRLQEATVGLEGLQLAHVLAGAGYSTRALIYSDGVEPWIVRELHRTGAFVETRARVVFSLPSYVKAKLPILDRRDPSKPDRRTTYRGGRRASDVPRISTPP